MADDTDDERRAFDDLFSATYEELKRLAASVKSSFARLTLSPTALVDEAWERLRRSPKLAGLSRLEFRRVAARAMRQVLVDAARRVDASKRHVELVTLDPSTGQPALDARQVLEIDHELGKLARSDPEAAQLIEYRYFAQMTDAEIAELMGTSLSAVDRKWRYVKARLKKLLLEA
ncbi:MAG TPA: sigma-70 family RNA polymerase sigma factor [Polyangia bacterium]|nr:sigma-70 family RNA polymerase sigma factor [Polyangia bacterium]